MHTNILALLAFTATLTGCAVENGLVTINDEIVPTEADDTGDTGMAAIGQASPIGITNVEMPTNDEPMDTDEVDSDVPSVEETDTGPTEDTDLIDTDEVVEIDTDVPLDTGAEIDTDEPSCQFGSLRAYLGEDPEQEVGGGVPLPVTYFLQANGCSDVTITDLNLAVTDPASGVWMQDLLTNSNAFTDLTVFDAPNTVGTILDPAFPTSTQTDSAMYSWRTPDSSLAANASLTEIPVEVIPAGEMLFYTFYWNDTSLVPYGTEVQTSLEIGWIDNVSGMPSITNAGGGTYLFIY